MNQRQAWIGGGILIAGLVATAIYFGFLRSGPETVAPGPGPGPLVKEKEKEKAPVEVKPLVFEPAPVSLAAATEHYYQGKDATQAGVKENAIIARRAALLKGRVLTREGQPLAGVKVHVAHHPELGHTQSQADGAFNLVVNGGGLLCIHYQKQDFLPLCRFINAPWQDHAWLPDVALISVDPQVTPIDLKSPAPIQVARGSVVKDKDGERQATLFIPQGTKAQMILPDKSLKALDSIKVRITEYTVGPNGPAAMPASLPPTSAYTYAFELSADEVIAGGIKVAGKDLILSQPLVVFVENFLKFPVGTPMPMGYFDNDKAAWIAADNGVVIQVLAPVGDLAEIDVEGKGKAADAATLKKMGVSDAERKQLAALYKPGQSLWRATVNHFSTHDLNQAPGDGKSSDSSGSQNSGNDPCDPPGSPAPPTFPGSLIDIHNQTMSEDIGIVGAPFRLHYRSRRAPGYMVARQLKIPLSGAKIPENLKRIDLEVHVAGQKHAKSFPAKADQIYTYVWDGKDADGRPVVGAQSATIRLGWVFDAVYQVPARFGEPPLRPTPTMSRQELTYWRDEGTTVGGWDGRGSGLGGWSLSVHHAYDLIGRTVYLGHGGVQGGADSAQQALDQTIVTVAGGGRNLALGNGGPAVQARLDRLNLPEIIGGEGRGRTAYHPLGLAVAPDGSLYIADGNNQIRKVTPDGIIQTIAGGGKETPKDGLKAVEAKLGYSSLALGADGSLYAVSGHRVWRIGLDGLLSVIAGTGDFGFSGDGGPAAKAALKSPAGIAVAPDGTIYIADSENNRIRRVGPDGIISTVAGTGELGLSGDGGPALQAKFYSPTGLALAPDGTLYISDAGNYVIRKLTPGGRLSTVAGLTRDDDTKGFGGDGGPALQAKFNEPTGLTLGPDGALYIADTANHRIRRVSLDGVVATLAGSPEEDSKYGGFGGDGGPASQAKLSLPTNVAFGPDGSLYVHQGMWLSTETMAPYRIRRIAPALPGFNNQEITVPSENGQQLYKFNATGRHLETLNTLTGKSIHRFDYDKNGLLTKIRDVYDNATTIERDADGHPLALVAPHGQRTILNIGADGYLAKVSNPAGESTKLTYHPGGLLATFGNARGQLTRFTYDDMGRLIKDEDAAGGFTALERTESARGFEVALTTALKPATTYSVDQLPLGAEDRLEKCCCGAEMKSAYAPTRGSEIRHPDGTVDTMLLQPNRPLGLHSPFVRNSTVTTPSKLKSESTFERKAKLATPSNPLSLQSIVNTSTVNGRKFTSTLDVAKRTVVSVTPGGRTRTTTFDEHGRTIKIEEPGVFPVHFVYGDKGRLITVRQGEGAEQRLMRVDYDADGNVAILTDPMKRTVGFEYNKAGRLVKQILPDQREIAFEFDPKGNLKSLTPPGKPAHAFEHTPVNLTSKYTPPEAGAAPRVTGYEFDKDRKLTKVSRPDGKNITLAYNKFGLLDSLTLPGQELRFTIDPKTEQLRNITGADGSLSFKYDGFLPTTTTWNGVIKGTVTRQYDNDFRMTSISVNGGPATDFKHDADGLLTQAGALKLKHDPKTGFLNGTKLGNVSTAHEYSSFGERKKFVANVAGKDVIAIDYKSDPLGRILKKTETIEGKTDVYAYEYAVAGRLKSVTKNGKTVGQYEYDSNGNRIKYEGQRGTFAGSYDAQDRIQSYGSITFKHNANGDLESKTEAGKTTAYEYDSLGNLRAVILPDGPKIEYVVDGANRRIGKKLGGKLVQGFLWQGQLKPIAELDGEGKVVSRFVYATGINVPEFLDKDGKTYRLVTDHLGSPRLVIDVASGTIAQRLDYDEFGNVLLDSSPGFQPFGFAGGLYDPHTKVIRFGRRDYNSVSGRWLAKDPIGFRGGDTNWFAYVSNDPVNLFDPFGLGYIDINGSVYGPGYGGNAGVMIGGSGWYPYVGVGIGTPGPGGSISYSPTDAAAGSFVGGSGGFGVGGQVGLGGGDGFVEGGIYSPGASATANYAWRFRWPWDWYGDYRDARDRTDRENQRRRDVRDASDGGDVTVPCP